MPVIEEKIETILTHESKKFSKEEFLDVVKKFDEYVKNFAMNNGLHVLVSVLGVSDVGRSSIFRASIVDANSMYWGPMMAQMQSDLKRILIHNEGNQRKN